MDTRKQPPDDKRIMWRYMDFAKFMFLISKNALYFSRIDQFEDQWEGVPPRDYLNFFAGMKEECYQMSMEWFLTGGKRRVAVHLIKTEKDVIELKERTFANCWHEQTHESDAMWKIYGTTTGAVAIKSNFAKLENVLENIEIPNCPNTKIHINSVVYINHRKKESYSEAVRKLSGNKDYLSHEVLFFFLKQEPFEYESEVRALFQLPSKSIEYGLCTEKLNLPELIDSVVIQPNSPEWFKERVKNALKQYQPRIPITQSQLNMGKFFEENPLDFSKLQNKLGEY